MASYLSKPLHTTLVKAAVPTPARIVFLHGLFGRGKNWSTVAKALTPEFESLLIDLPNHGESGWSESFDYVEMADYVADFLADDFALAGPVDLVAHSMGGKVAMLLALRHPELVRRLVVVDISPGTTDSAESEFTHLFSSLASLELTSIESRSEAHEALRAKIPSDTVRGFLLQNLKRDASSGFAWEPNLRLLHASLPKIMGFAPVTQSAFIGPVLWVKGAKSGYITEANLPTMRELFPRVELVVIEGAGHWVHSERPREFIENVLNFLLEPGL